MNFLRGGTHSIAARYSAAFLFAVLLCAPAHSSETVQLWVQSIFGAQQTHSHLKPFFDEFFTAVGRNYRPKYGNNFPALSRTCASEKYDVVMGSYGTAMRQFERECGYHVVALTDQSIYLYTRDRSSLENIRRVGVIPGVRASEVDLRKVLPGGFVVIPYRDHIQATVALLDGDIDGLTSSSVAIKRLAPVLQDSIHIAHTFEEKGHGVAMLSPRFYATPEGQAFRHFILANGETSVQIYVEEMGISRWRSPDKEKPATTAGSE
ncbi:hypothetical protein [Litorivivens sp.]|uniref:hypothetical protein n=1 Tax=Litorivivens sp. TaxID=2020868 RepID=UPI0035646D9A